MICFQVQQGSLRSTLTTRVELWVCVCGEEEEEEEGVGKDTNYRSRRVQDGKPLVTCVGKDWSISPTAKITWFLQEVRLQRENRGQEEAWEEVHTREDSGTASVRLNSFSITGALCVCVSELKRAYSSSACYHDMSHLDNSTHCVIFFYNLKMACNADKG